jgi:hypothetical protein
MRCLCIGTTAVVFQRPCSPRERLPWPRLRARLRALDHARRYANGDVYTGELLGLTRQGAGECKYGGGASVYEGQWVADRHEGHGRLSSRRGEEFDGEWLAGEPHGQVRAHYFPLIPAV